MTKYLRALPALAILGGLILLTGCEAQTTVDDGLPTPRLSAPAMTAPPVLARSAPVAPAPPPIAENRTYSATPTRPGRSAAVPAGWVPTVPLNHWTWIIVHHSDSDYGSAAIIDKWHRERGFDELGYHFVIGNGTNSGDGQIEIGPRWTKQKWGAHDNALDNRYNINGIGVCLVGDFDKNHPTAAQVRSLLRLVTYLERTYHIPPDHVLGHGETKDTHCPGRYIDMAEIRQDLRQQLADAPEIQNDALASGELMH